ncbi:hypothetical protein [Aureimonas sp. AU40]|uniref:hypothetical protein n=1 Tax=Aureimonas sp. AU40 TaxID=1637747 RepID=UPI000784E643|nr:hypothetical protein [Aureimonas sp. AU40]
MPAVFDPKPKFRDCRSCTFFKRGNTAPECGLCDSGEFYERKRSVREIREMNDSEAMTFLRNEMTYDD